MKTKLNLICLVLLAVMVADLSGGRFEFNIGKNAANYENEIRQNGSSSLQQSEVIDARLLALLPISEKQTALTVTNKLTGKEVKVWPKTLYVEPDTYQSPSQWLSLLAVLAGLAAFVCAIYAFIRFIIHVNHECIFDHRNVRMLRMAGWGLLVYGGIDSVWTLCDYLSNTRTFAMEGYAVDWLSAVEYTPLLLALIAFVAAQVFAMAVKTKEEQDLTI